MYISDFEQGIDEKILARGKKYFADSLVIDLWAPSPNVYCAVVEGSIRYDAEIQLGANGEVLHHGCDCPYDLGEYCKHEVAVFFAIREHLKQGATLKQQGQKQGLRSLLSDMGKDDLVELLLDLATEYDLREEIIYRLDAEGDDDSYDDND